MIAGGSATKQLSSQQCCLAGTCKTVIVLRSSARTAQLAHSHSQLWQRSIQPDCVLLLLAV
jgi:hypothetical protein